MTKYCVNCIHFVLSDGSPLKPELGRCSRLRLISMVTGQPKPISDLPFASVERMDKFKPEESCGYAGIHFTAKETSNV